MEPKLNGRQVDISLRLGTGVFATPSKIFLGVGNAGTSLLLWAFGGLVALAGLHVWNELGLSVPRKYERSVPRSGGEKNYVRVPPAASASRVPLPELLTLL